MPLKHRTETILVVVLALATIVTGVLLATLPAIPDGFFPWAGIFVATVLYPALLYPLLRSNRADYSFRALHFAPVAMTIVWMLLQIIQLQLPDLHLLSRIYTFGWSAIAVAATFVLLIAYCLEVIRRRVPRMSFLAFLFFPFLALALMSERSGRWNTELAALLWNTPRPIQIAQENGLKSSSSSTAQMSSYLSPSSKGEKDLSSSSLPEEEAWRQKLRAVEEGKVHSQQSTSFKAQGPLIGVKAAASLSSGPGVAGKTIVVKKKHLTKAGGEMEAVALFLLAAYAGTVHGRVRRRMV